jgi:trypsin
MLSKLFLAVLAVPAALAMPHELETRAKQIVGGTAAAAGEFPYIVSLSRSGSHFCGGSLIDSTTVVTAAHCSTGVTASSVRVRAGSLQWASGGTQVGVSRITYHPSFSSSTLNNDVAVWKLSTAIPASSTVGYVTLPAQSYDPASGSTTTVAGWGVTSESSGSLPAALRKVSVPVISRATCRAQYGTSDITDNMFCAGLEAGGKDSCQGDSGGPIINSAGALVGVVSWGSGCARPDLAGVYTRIGNYVSWINSQR